MSNVTIEQKEIASKIRDTVNALNGLLNRAEILNLHVGLEIERNAARTALETVRVRNISTRSVTL